MELWLMFIDFDKVFDSPLHGEMWQSLAAQKVPEGILKSKERLSAKFFSQILQ